MSSIILGMGKQKILPREYYRIRRLRVKSRLTLAEIAQRYGVSKARIHQILGNTGWSADYAGRKARA